MSGASATVIAISHKITNVRNAAFAEGCFLAKGWVTDMNLSHVTNDKISTEDSHDNVLKNPETKLSY